MATNHELEVQLTSHEAVCAERYQTFIKRVDRLEMLLIKTAGVLIVGMGGIVITILMRGH
ncbi:MAG: hypothetical protein EBU96_01295 [Actinobacteria bacterium]|jgi:hypothetical protein|nr:hypothetical protein [Actinomycetota bacterium]